MIKSISIVTLTTFLFSTLSAPWVEAGFWEERKKVVAEAGLVSAGAGKSTNLAGLPAAQSLNLLPATKNPADSIKTEHLAFKTHQKPNNNQYTELIQTLSQYGAVRELHLSPKPEAPLILHIQDAHGIDEAQKNIYAIIEELFNQKSKIKNQKSLLIGLEGAEGAFTLDSYRSLPDKTVVKEIADYFLKEGYIGGPEYAGLTADERLELWGIEDTGLYSQNIKALKESQTHKSQMQKILKHYQQQINQLKQTIYSPALKQFDKYFLAYHSQDMSIGDYVRFLVRGNSRSFKQINIFMTALDIENTLDFKKIEKERSQLVHILVKKLNKNEVNQLVQQSMQHRAGRLTYAQYYGILKQLCRDNHINFKKFKQFDAYIRYVCISEQINREQFINEFTQLEHAAQKTLAATPKQKKLIDLTKNISLIEKLINHQMTPDDWARYQKSKTNIYHLPKQITNLSSGKAVHVPLPSLLAPYEAFCEYAIQRNKTLVNNLLKKIVSREACSVAVLVAGGFHTAGITDLLKKNNASYIVVTPQITQIPKNHNYLDIFSKQPLPLEKLFTGETIHLTYPKLLADNMPVGYESAAAQLKKIFFKLYAQKSGDSGIIHPKEHFDDKEDIQSLINQLKEVIGFVLKMIDTAIQKYIQRYFPYLEPQTVPAVPHSIEMSGPNNAAGSSGLVSHSSLTKPIISERILFEHERNDSRKKLYRFGVEWSKKSGFQIKPEHQSLFDEVVSLSERDLVKTEYHIQIYTLHEIINELISNAQSAYMRANTDGEIFVNIYYQGDDLIIEVSDNGIGLRKIKKNASGRFILEPNHSHPGPDTGETECNGICAGICQLAAYGRGGTFDYLKNQNGYTTTARLTIPKESVNVRLLVPKTLSKNDLNQLFQTASAQLFGASVKEARKSVEQAVEILRESEVDNISGYQETAEGVLGNLLEQGETTLEMNLWLYALQNGINEKGTGDLWALLNFETYWQKFMIDFRKNNGIVPVMAAERWEEKYDMSFVSQNRVGSGGESIVYKGSSRATGENVVFKVEKKINTDSAIYWPHGYYVLRDWVFRLALSVDKKSRVLKPLDAGYIDDEIPVAFTVSECKNEKNLNDELKSIANAGVLEEFTIEFLEWLLTQLSLCHRYGVLLRDIHVENIVLDEPFEEGMDLKRFLEGMNLIDLAAATTLKPNQKNKTGDPHGREGFVSPWTVFNQYLSYETDLFSVGALGYFLMNNEAPYAPSDFIKTSPENIVYGKQSVSDDLWKKVIWPLLNHRFPSAEKALEAVQSLKAERAASLQSSPFSIRNAQKGFWAALMVSIGLILAPLILLWQGTGGFELSYIWFGIVVSLCWGGTLGKVLRGGKELIKKKDDVTGEDMQPELLKVFLPWRLAKEKQGMKVDVVKETSAPKDRLGEFASHQDTIKIPSWMLVKSDYERFNQLRALILPVVLSWEGGRAVLSRLYIRSSAVQTILLITAFPFLVFYSRIKAKYQKQLQQDMLKEFLLGEELKKIGFEGLMHEPIEGPDQWGIEKALITDNSKVFINMLPDWTSKECKDLANLIKGMAAHAQDKPGSVVFVSKTSDTGTQKLLSYYPELTNMLANKFFVEVTQNQLSVLGTSRQMPVSQVLAHLNVHKKDRQTIRVITQSKQDIDDQGLVMIIELKRLTDRIEQKIKQMLHAIIQA